MEHTLGIPANNSMKYPNMFAYEYASVEYYGGGVPYFECHYTTQTCFRGVTAGSGAYLRFAGVILDAKDRTTVLKHVACWRNFGECNDYDKGIWTFNKPEFAEPITGPDVPPSCVEARRNGEKCPGFG
jgi:hypothetical protein